MTRHLAVVLFLLIGTGAAWADARSDCARLSGLAGGAADIAATKVIDAGIVDAFAKHGVN